MASRTRTGLLAAVLVIGAHVAMVAAQSPRISTGDQLKIVVVNIEIGATEFVVDADGTINYPYLGKIKVAGLTSTELATKVGADLVTEKVLTRAPQIMIDLKQLESKTVTVAGAVIKGGSYPFAGETTVFAILLQAGGAAANAGDELVITRRPETPGADRETVTVSRRDIESGETNVPMRDGDHLFVPKAEQVYISGFVTAPGAVTVDKDMTLTKVLALVGGVTELGASNRIQVTRGGKRVDEKQTKDINKFIVLPGDVIYVPKRKM